MFVREKVLVKKALPDIINFFNTKKINIKVLKEPPGLFGIPDVLIFNGEIIAFEFKLSNWPAAIRQAFRYTSFSTTSYVIMDEDYVNRALKNIDEFKKYNIGLGSYGEEGFRIYHKPTKRQPYSKRLLNKANALFA